MADVVVVGAGVGGLCAAVRLRAAGHRVSVLERHHEVGGKLAVRRRDGFSFDIGPSLLTLPGELDDVLALAGTSLAAHAELVRLDPQLRYHWPDGTTLDVRDDPEATAAAFEALSPGAGAAWRRLRSHGGRIWEVSLRTFFAGPMGSPLQLARRVRSPSDLVAIDALRSLHRAAASTFDDPRLVQWAGRYATYSGSSPFRAPATLACIPYVESAHGAWYPMGGLGRVRDALEAAARALGVVVHTGTEVARIEATAERVTGVRLAGAERLAADVVVANADAHHLYRDLLPDARALATVERAEPSMSGLVVLAGVQGATAGVAHHTVWFSGDDRAEFDQLAAGRLADDPTVYACMPSETDPSQAPEGHESWFLLVNAPAGWQGDAEAARDRVLATLARRGVDLRPRLVFTEVVTPADLERRYRSPGGAIYGTSSNGRRAAFLRPGNRGSRRGLYLVGGSSHPGGGLPLVARSARIVAAMVEADGW